ncbi:MAG: bifunctional demethylmenaquinone methyltransferase/2-methoxy-6-polyprenyl-1,4-benzoquinol methylase UbiE [Bacillota bacterium]
MDYPQEYRKKEVYVHKLFASIAHRYDLLNTLLSLNRDKHWRRFAVAQCGLEDGGYGLDVCCGTGMLALEQAKATGLRGRIVGVDFCEEMLAKGRKNIAGTAYKDIIELIRGNAMDLPFPDDTFDCATIGFALRNVPSIRRTIEEMMRVVRPGGRVVSLEFAKPSFPVFKQIYHVYCNRLVPFIGRLGAGIDGPYSYLPNSMKAFPHQKEIRNLFAAVGLADARCHELTGGIVAVHVGTKR